MDGKILKLRIDWSELDLLGHVNNIAISRYFQAARIHYMDQVDLKVFPGMETGPILAAAKVDFLRQLHFPGNVTVHTRCGGIRHTSLTLLYDLLDDAGTLCARSEEVIVHFDFRKQTPIPITDEIRRAIAEAEGTSTADLG